MRESGVVIKNTGEYVDVRMVPNGACENCGACFLDHSKLQTLHIKQHVNANPGDPVQVEVVPTFALKSAFLLFMLPLLMLVIGYYLFQSVFYIPGINAVYQGILGGSLGIILTYVVVHYYDKKLQKSGKSKQVRIVESTVN